MITESKNDEVLRTEYVKATTGAVRTVLEKEFGMIFPSDYAGN